MSRAAALALCTATLALAGCGGGGESTGSTASTTTTTTAPKPPPKETRDPLPDVHPEWERFVNERGGYALLLPRGWEANRRGPQTLIRSFDRLVAISIAPDRSAAALATPLEDYATNTAGALRGFEGGLRVDGSRPLRGGPYDAAEVFGTGRSRDGVDQRVSVIALRRHGLVTVTAVLAANAKRAARESARVGRRVIATIRTRPPQDGRSGRSG